MMVHDGCFLLASVLGAREKTCIFENMLIIM